MAGPRQRRRTARIARSNTGGARHGGQPSRNARAVFAGGSTAPTDTLLLAGASGWLLLSGDQQVTGTDYLQIT